MNERTFTIRLQEKEAADLAKIAERTGIKTDNGTIKHILTHFTEYQDRMSKAESENLSLKREIDQMKREITNYFLSIGTLEKYIINDKPKQNN